MSVSDLQERDARRFLVNLEDVVTHLHPGEPVPGLAAIDGPDASGTVSCVVDLGGNLAQVQITDGWWHAVGPHGVAAAVLQALRFARDKAGLARLLLARHAVAYPVPTPDYRTMFATEAPRPLPPYDSADFADELRRTVDRAASVLQRAERTAAERDRGQRHEVTGPRGLFRVVLAGFTVVAAVVNEYGLRPTDGADLAADARDALLAARPSFALQREI